MARKRSGPAPLPANVIEMRGNVAGMTEEELQARRDAEAALPARPLRPVPPANFDPYALEVWERLVPALEHLGLLTELDRESLIAACQCWAIAQYGYDELRKRKADGTVDGRTKRLEVLGVDLGHGGNTKRNPALMVFFQAQEQWRKWCVDFGLSPAARASLRPGASAPRAGEVGSDDDDDDAFFGT